MFPIIFDHLFEFQNKCLMQQYFNDLLVGNYRDLPVTIKSEVVIFGRETIP